MDALPANLRQRVLSGYTESASDDDEADDEEEQVEKGWGSKKMYRGGDTADLEIGQDEQDAFDEEEAAIEMQQEKLKKMQERDFFVDFDEDEDGYFSSSRRKDRDPAIMRTIDSTINSSQVRCILGGFGRRPHYVCCFVAGNERNQDDFVKCLYRVFFKAAT